MKNRIQQLETECHDLSKQVETLERKLHEIVDNDKQR